MRAAILETPEAFRQHMEENVPPPPGRDLRTEIIGASWDWQAYFEPIALGASGLVITKNDKSINHCWRVVRRADLPHYSKGNLPMDIEAHHQDNMYDVLLMVLGLRFDVGLRLLPAVTDDDVMLMVGLTTNAKSSRKDKLGQTSK